VIWALANAVVDICPQRLEAPANGPAHKRYGRLRGEIAPNERRKPSRPPLIAPLTAQRTPTALQRVHRVVGAGLTFATPLSSATVFTTSARLRERQNRASLAGPVKR
jgi:hypothetical protein